MNITLSLDDSLIAAAKVLAAQQDTSISALVRQGLEAQVARGAEVAASGASGVPQVLVDYAMGRCPRSVAMQTLGLNDYGALLRLLNAAGLPHPLVPLVKRQAMAAEMVAAVRGTAAGR